MLFSHEFLILNFLTFIGRFMNKKKSKHKPGDRNRTSSEEKTNVRLPGDKDDFNTGSHSPSALRNVGPGYDDTGLGNNAKAAADQDKHPDSEKVKKKRNPVKE